MKKMMFLIFIMGAIQSQAQTAGIDLIQGTGGTKIIIQKDLKAIGQDEELSTLNVLHINKEEGCRIESSANEIKKGTVFHLGYIYNSYSDPTTTIELISQDETIKASIECLNRHENGIIFYNRALSDALLMKN